MPAKYRRMADFHEYYSGVRKAPCLTLFVGGNHEASNYLFELYYGGWVAPNIYYMGAANVLRFGPLRIAGLSGIFKRYHYYKPHFERLPYNESDYYGVYHVRELDVRKLLNIRTQVDIGISHDWPQGVEWYGNHAKLFQRKAHLRSDAEAGKLGSPAAKSCLGRLRPANWFSAHLHVKYPATVDHERHDSTPAHDRHTNGPSENVLNIAHRPSPLRGAHQDASRSENHALSAWNSFSTDAPKVEAEEADRLRKEQQQRQDEEERTGVKSVPSYTFNETWKQVKTNDELSRQLNTVRRSEIRSQDIQYLPQVDGAACSSILPFKRKPSPDLPDGQEGSVIKSPKMSSESQRLDQGAPDVNNVSLRENVMANLSGESKSHKNENEIEIDFSGSDEEAQSSGNLKVADIAPDVLTAEQESSLPSATNAFPSKKEAGEGGNDQAPSLSTGDSKANTSKNYDHVYEEGDLSKQTNLMTKGSSAVPGELRAQLASISSSFASAQPTQTPAPPPFPTAISNTRTNFLALDKCETHRQFLELVEVLPVSEQDEPATRPFCLVYDKEWLAITRAFADELELGGGPEDHCPPNLSEAIYRERVEKEEAWVEENIVQKNLMTVPENFTVTAPTYDPHGPVSKDTMPREFPNPQTDAFCKLIGIENKFAISDPEIDQRISRGPRPEPSEGRNFKRGGRGYGQGDGRGRFRGGGRRGGRGGRRGIRGH